MDVVVVGPGRVGSALAAALGLPRPIGRGEGIPPARVVVVAVPHAALADVAARLPAGSVALHTAGVLPADALAPHWPTGVFHPLMTFPGPAFPAPDLRDVPVRVGGDPAAVAAAEALARRLGMRALHVPGDARLYHAAAVIAGNFATVLLAEASAVLAAAGIAADAAPGLLAPLALASLRNAVQDPASALTGPAARGDLHTLRAHREALVSAGLIAQAELYDLLAERASRLASGRK